MGEVEADVVDGGAWERGYKLEKEVEQTHFGVDKGYGKRTDVGHGEQQEHEDGGVDNGSGERNGNEVGETKIAGETTEIVKHERKDKELGREGDGEQRPEKHEHAVTKQTSRTDEKAETMVEEEDAKHCHERQLKTYVEKTLRTAHEQQYGCHAKGVERHVAATYHCL